jgi:hypothetical protein
MWDSLFTLDLTRFISFFLIETSLDELEITLTRVNESFSIWERVNESLDSVNIYHNEEKVNFSIY